MKMNKSLKTVTVVHGLKGEHTDTVADTEEVAYGTIALNEFLRHDNVDAGDTTIMFDAICHVEVTEEKVSLDIEDDTCQTDEPVPGEPYFTGVTNTTSRQGMAFDLEEGVKAFDGDGNEIPFTVTPDQINECEVDQQVFTYEAEGITKERTITVTQIPDPTITGMEQLTVEVGEEFDPLDGVEGTDGNGNEVEVTVEKPQYPYLYARGGSANIEVQDYQYSEKAPVTLIDPSIEWAGKKAEIRFTNLYVSLSSYGQQTTPYDHEDVITDSQTVQADYSDEVWFSFPNGNAIPVAYATDGIQGEGIGLYVGNEGDARGTYSWDSAEIWVIGEAEQGA